MFALNIPYMPVLLLAELGKFLHPALQASQFGPISFLNFAQILHLELHSLQFAPHSVQLVRQLHFPQLYGLDFGFLGMLLVA